MVALPFPDSSITTAKFITDSQYMLGTADEDYSLLAKNIAPPFAFETRQKDGAHSKASNFSRFSEFKNLYITGHANGVINFWDLSSPLFIPILSLTQQSEDDSSSNGVPVTALSFNISSGLLISGDQSGMVRIIKFMLEPFTTESSLMSLQGVTPAEKLLEFYHRKWGGSVDPVYQEVFY